MIGMKKNYEQLYTHFTAYGSTVSLQQESEKAYIVNVIIKSLQSVI